MVANCAGWGVLGGCGPWRRAVVTGRWSAPRSRVGREWGASRLSTISAVQQRELGRTGLRVSALGFGCGAVGGLMVLGEPSEQKRAVQRALDAGITYFDTAASYGDGRSETNLGRAMDELGTWSRVVVGTKVRLPSLDQPRKDIRSSLEASLQRLRRSSVDVFYLHNPISRA